MTSQVCWNLHCTCQSTHADLVKIPSEIRRGCPTSATESNPVPGEIELELVRTMKATLSALSPDLIWDSINLELRSFNHPAARDANRHSHGSELYRNGILMSLLYAGPKAGLHETISTPNPSYQL